MTSHLPVTVGDDRLYKVHDLRDVFADTSQDVCRKHLEGKTGNSVTVNNNVFNYHDKNV